VVLSVQRPNHLIRNNNLAEPKSHRDGGSLPELLVNNSAVEMIENSPPVKWYCLHTKPLKEAQVASYCSTFLGVQTYFPRLRQYRTIRRQRRLVTRPLFPRYLFCRFDAAQHYRAVRYSPDMLDIVSNGNGPTIVPDALVENLQSWAGSEVDIITLQPSLRAGDKVEITAGPFQGFSGTILKESEERARVTILLSFLQNGAHLSMDRADLRLIA
jgi:transcriptional antiterminator RfaH